MGLTLGTPKHPEDGRVSAAQRLGNYLQHQVLCPQPEGDLALLLGQMNSEFSLLGKLSLQE
jgi:glycyl-tRNA synthetase alpha subunit